MCFMCPTADLTENVYRYYEISVTIWTNLHGYLQLTSPGSWAHTHRFVIIRTRLATRKTACINSHHGHGAFLMGQE
jgi:hypothetical protein